MSAWKQRKSTSKLILYFIFLLLASASNLIPKLKLSGCLNMSPCFYRLVRLLEEIMGEKENKTLVFVETKRKCDDIARKMKRDG